MALHEEQSAWDVETALCTERDRLVRLCAHLSGDPDAAEDLAQETLVEAWRHAHTLRDQQRGSQWLSGIARNVCLRWRRWRAQAPARLVSPDDEHDHLTPAREPRLVDDFDLEVELDRQELALLLDRALALLPATTRTVLIARYAEELPQAEIAARLGVSEGAVAVRLHRGRLALRQLLMTDLRDEARSYGLIQPAEPGWQETRIWCSLCGDHRLLGRFTSSEFTLRCPQCHPTPAVVCVRTTAVDVLAGLKSYWPAYTRLMERLDRYFSPALPLGTVRCAWCSQSVRLQRGPAAHTPYYIVAHCTACGLTNETALKGLVLARPEGRRFRREHRRIRVLPEREVEAQGCAAVITSFASVTGTARLDVIAARATYEVLSVHGAPPERTDGCGGQS